MDQNYLLPFVNLWAADSCRNLCVLLWLKLNYLSTKYLKGKKQRKTKEYQYNVLRYKKINVYNDLIYGKKICYRN